MEPKNAKTTMPSKAKKKRRPIGRRRQEILEQNTCMEASVQALYELAGIDPLRRGVLVRDEGGADAHQKNNGK